MHKIPNHLPAGTMLRGDTYRIVRFIAAGGFGCTYEAEHVMLRKRVAIKEFFMQDYCNREEHTRHVTVGTQGMHDLVDKYRRKFVDEARALSGLHHEGIVSVSDVFEENGTAYYVMDYVEGQSLAERCKGNPLPEKAAIYYIRQVAEALIYVHDHNRLHLDVKPGNIMIEASGRTVLIDFGVSKQYDAALGENTTTLLGYSPGYAPLEQMEGDVRQFLPATDVYALGATLYFLLTGKTPPSASRRINEDMPPLPADISAATRQAVEQAMEIRKKDRPQSVREFVALLDAAVRAEDPRPVPSPISVPPTPAQQKSRKVPTGLLVALIVALCAALIVLLARGCSTSSDDGGGGDTVADSIRKDSVIPGEKAKPVEPAEVEKREKAAVTTGTHAGHEWVDLGLSVKWATCNVGASSPTGYGNFYAWGETSTKSSYDRDNCKTYNRSMSDIRGNSSYDAARANWGGSWRLPTKAECDELVNNCTRQWTTQNGVKGMRFTSKRNGNSIFFPAAGYRRGTSTDGAGEYGTYWSSTPFESGTQSAYSLCFHSGGSAVTDWRSRYSGYSVRPVVE
ncbi:MAG: protein kinase [Bacteroidales bacterium]|nr:protein kinase [Bacteroidales bacterium]